MTPSFELIDSAATRNNATSEIDDLVRIKKEEEKGNPGYDNGTVPTVRTLKGRAQIAGAALGVSAGEVLAFRVRTLWRTGRPCLPGFWAITMGVDPNSNLVRFVEKRVCWSPSNIIESSSRFLMDYYVVSVAGDCQQPYILSGPWIPGPPTRTYR